MMPFRLHLIVGLNVLGHTIAAILVACCLYTGYNFGKMFMIFPCKVNYDKPNVIDTRRKHVLKNTCSDDSTS